MRGFDVPTEKNPRRPVATEDRYQATRAKTDDVTMEIRWNGKPETMRSHLSEVLDVIHGTGHRLSAVLQTSVSRPRPTGWTPRSDPLARRHGQDRQGGSRPHRTGRKGTIDRVLRERPGIGGAYLFPAPGDLAKPVSRHLAAKWLEEAEKLAGLPKLDGSLWHAYRRKWATERKHLPDADVAAAGGWANPNTLRLVYQQADQETMLRVVLERGELREAK